MTDSFDPHAYLAFLQKYKWRALGTIAAATGITLLISFLLPARYTATATLVIEPPAANDPRAATAVSAVYLESLKAYEQFAASDSLFARACEQFQLLPGPEPPPMETLKKRVLRVNKVKDTKLLRISVTLNDPHTAHRVARFLAEETVALNRSISRDGDRALLIDLDTQVSDVREKLATARAAYADLTSTGSDRVLSEELLSLSDLKARSGVELVAARASLAEARAVQDAEETAALDARVSTLNTEVARIERESSAKSAQLAGLRAKLEESAEALRIAEENFNAWSRRATEMASSVATRTEQLRVVDPGIVPQKRSYPDPLLFSLAAMCVSTFLILGWLTLLYGMQRPATAAAEPVRVIRGVR